MMNLTSFWWPADLPRLFVLSLLYMVLCYKSPTQAKMKAFVYVASAHTSGRARQLLESHGFCSGGECFRTTGSPRTLHWRYLIQKDLWSGGARKQDCSAGPFFQGHGCGGEISFQTFGVFLSCSGGQNLLYLKTSLHLIKFCSNKN